MAGVIKQVIDSFEDIGKDVVQEVAKVPTEIAGKALESLGASSQKPKQQGNQTAQPQGALQQIEQTSDQKIKRAIARDALAQLAGNQKQKEPTVQERIAQEEAAKKEALKKQQATQMAPLAAVSSKPKRGNLYAKKQKSTAVENKASRQD
jgi:hypothetical protein